jgi:hypothetical protein
VCPLMAALHVIESAFVKSAAEVAVVAAEPEVRPRRLFQGGECLCWTVARGNSASMVIKPAGGGGGSGPCKPALHCSFLRGAENACHVCLGFVTSPRCFPALHGCGDLH